MPPRVLVLVLLSALLHAVWSVAIKGSREPMAFNVLQTVPTVPLTLALLPFFEVREVPREVWGFLAATGVAHGCYFYWLSRAFERADLSLVYPIARSTPAFVPFVAAPLMGESISVPGALGIATVMAGLWLVHAGGRLRWQSLLAPGIGYAYLTLLATVAYSLSDKGAMAELARADWTGPASRTVVFYFLLSSAGTVVFLPLALRRAPPSRVLALARTEWRGALGAFVVSFGSYGLILEALQTASVSYVVAVRQTSVLFAVVLGIFWLGEKPGARRALGALATVAGVAVIGLYG